MGFFDKLAGGGGGGIPAEPKEADVGITPKGQEKLDKGLISGRLFDTLIAVKKCQPANVTEVATELRVEKRKARYYINCLLSSGCLTKI
jgi:hypothetical protein